MILKYSFGGEVNLGFKAKGTQLPIEYLRNGQITSDEINELRSRSWEGTTGGDWTPELERGFGWVTARDGERLVGFVRLLWDGGSHIFLLDTTVHRDYQRRGIGRGIVREAVSLSETCGAEWLHVDYEEHLDSFYRGCGFKPTLAGLIRLS